MFATDADGSALGAQPEAVGGGLQGHRKRQLALSRRMRQQALKLLVAVAIDGHARVQTVGHLVRIEPVALGTVHPESLQLALAVDEAQAVAIGKRGGAGNIERVAAHFLHRTHKLTHRLGCVGRENIGLAAMQEIGGEPSVEGLLQRG